MFVIFISTIFPLYVSWKSIYPSNKELIYLFENTTNINFPNSAEIISKRDYPGFNETFRIFTFKVEKLEEYLDLKTKINQSNIKSYNEKSNYLMKNNQQYNIQFVDKETQVIFEIME